MKMRKFFACLLASSMILGLAACGDSKESKEEAAVMLKF